MQGRPPSRTGATGELFLQRYMLVIGGMYNERHVNEVQIFDVQAGEWLPVIQTGEADEENSQSILSRTVRVLGQAPSGRDKHATVLAGHKLYLFGGWGQPGGVDHARFVPDNDPGLLQPYQGLGWNSELFILDLSELETSGRLCWSYIPASGPLWPAPRAAHTLTLLGDGKTALLFGGRTEVCKMLEGA